MPPADSRMRCIHFYLRDTSKNTYVVFSYVYVTSYTPTHLISSSAQLLEPFKLEHGIGSGAATIPELERTPGATPSIMAQGGLGPNTELEDPPGLYEKVYVHRETVHTVLKLYC